LGVGVGVTNGLGVGVAVSVPVRAISSTRNGWPVIVSSDWIPIPPICRPAAPSVVNGIA
jgi:hypothetical protein